MAKIPSSVKGDLTLKPAQPDTTTDFEVSTAKDHPAKRLDTLYQVPMKDLDQFFARSRLLMKEESELIAERARIEAKYADDLKGWSEECEKAMNEDMDAKHVVEVIRALVSQDKETEGVHRNLADLLVVEEPEPQPEIGGFNELFAKDAPPTEFAKYMQCYPQKELVHLMAGYREAARAANKQLEWTEKFIKGSPAKLVAEQLKRVEESDKAYSLSTRGQEQVAEEAGKEQEGEDAIHVFDKRTSICLLASALEESSEKMMADEATQTENNQDDVSKPLKKRSFFSSFLKTNMKQPSKTQSCAEGKAKVASSTEERLAKGAYSKDEKLGKVAQSKEDKLTKGLSREEHLLPSARFSKIDKKKRKELAEVIRWRISRNYNQFQLSCEMSTLNSVLETIAEWEVGGVEEDVIEGNLCGGGRQKN